MEIPVFGLFSGKQAKNGKRCFCVKHGSCFYFCEINFWSHLPPKPSDIEMIQKSNLAGIGWLFLVFYFQRHFNLGFRYPS